MTECLLIRKSQRYDLRTQCCLVPLVFTFFHLVFVHNDCAYRHTYEVFVLGAIRLLVSNRLSIYFYFVAFNSNFHFLHVCTLHIWSCRDIIIPISLLHSLLATVIKGYGNFTSENSILSGYPVLRGPVSLLVNS